MKLVVLQEDFAPALSTALRFVNTRAQLPVLSNIHLSASKTKLRINATNLENSVSIPIGAKVDEEGEITVPARVLTDIVAGLAKGQVTLEAKNEKLTISTSNSKSDISSMLAVDFPKVPMAPGKESVKLNAQDLLASLNHVLYSSSSDEARPVLTGVYFVFNKDNLTLVATDGFRLSKRKISLENGVPGSMIIPKEILAEISKIGKGFDDIALSVKADENQLIIQIGDITLSSRIIDGSFPDYEKIIPNKSKVRINVDKEELLRAIRVSGVIARDSANVVKFAVNKSGLSLLAESSKSGKQNVKVDTKVEGSEESEISFNYKYVEEFLLSIKGDSVDIKIIDETSPGVFLDSSEPDLVHLIMPVKI